MLLTPHFALSEFTRSDTALRLGLDNSLDPALHPAHQTVIDNLQRLCRQVLEPLRQHAALPITVNSGYRSPQLNRAVGGQPQSNHLTGCAADLRIPSLETGIEWFQWVRQHLEFDELIWERSGPTSTPWIHVALRPEGNRHRLITNLVKHPAGAISSKV